MTVCRLSSVLGGKAGVGILAAVLTQNDSTSDSNRGGSRAWGPRSPFKNLPLWPRNAVSNGCIVLVSGLCHAFSGADILTF